MSEAEPSAAPRPLRRHARAFGSSLAAQGVFSANSLVIGLLAGRQLTRADFGRYSIAFAFLAVVFALADALLGEARTIFDDEDPRIHSTLRVAQVVLAALAAGVALGFAAMVGIRGGAAPALACASGLWAIESGVRRALIARLQFGRLIVNDAAWLAGVLAVCAGWGIVSRLTLTGFLWAWASGSFVALVAGRYQLPRRRVEFAQLSASTTAELLRFGGWRAAQAVLRPLSLLAVRVLVAAMVAEAVVGELEFGRLLTAPVLTLAIGSSQALLPLLNRTPDAERRHVVRLLTIGMGAVGLAAVAAVCVGIGVFGEGWHYGEVPIRAAAVFSWGAFAVAFAAGAPVMMLRIVERDERSIFAVRAADNVLGVGLAVVMIAADLPLWSPCGLAIGAWIGTLWLWFRRRPASAARRPAETGFPRESPPKQL